MTKEIINRQKNLNDVKTKTMQFWKQMNPKEKLT